MSLLKDRAFRATALSHLSIDLLNSQHPLLLAVLSIPLGLSNSLIGLVSTIYSLSGSLSQPLFGMLADRIGNRLVATSGLAWMVVCFSFALSIQGPAALVFLVLAAFGSGAYHPAATAEATERGRIHLARMETTAASFFFFFGQGGLFLGPALGGPLIDQWGPMGLFLLFILILPVGFYMLPRIEVGAEGFSALLERQTPPPIVSVRWSYIVPFVMTIFSRSWTQMSMMTFLPKYLQDLGFRPGVFGPVSALYMGGSAFGGILGAWLADRFGDRYVMTISLFLACLPLFFYGKISATWLLIMVTLFAGAFIGASHSILVVLAQRLLPGKSGVASGLVLGFTFASGSIGAFFSGWIADKFGFQLLFIVLGGIMLLSTIGSIWMHASGRTRSSPGA
ncbi:MAG: MFS transporter [Anaerolineales bacterium]|nr:MFS transporter [Anaerolineales bacterium]